MTYLKAEVLMTQGSYCPFKTIFGAVENVKIFKTIQPHYLLISYRHKIKLLYMTSLKPFLNMTNIVFLLKKIKSKLNLSVILHEMFRQNHTCQQCSQPWEQLQAQTCACQLAVPTHCRKLLWRTGQSLEHSHPPFAVPSGTPLRTCDLLPSLHRHSS